MKKLNIEFQELPYAVEEAMNRLRINIKFCGKNTRKILITSSMPNEGKSSVDGWRQIRYRRESKMSIYMIRSKSRGHQRKFKRLLRWMDKIDPFKNANDLPFKDTEDSYEHFHVPCGPWLSKPKTSGKIKTAFCKKWLGRYLLLFHLGM